MCKMMVGKGSISRSMMQKRSSLDPDLCFAGIYSGGVLFYDFNKGKDCWE